MTMLQLRYFASLRDQLNCDSETLEWHDSLKTAVDVRAFLINRGEPWASTLLRPAVLIAINQEMSSSDSTINDGDEIAFFPPVTGG
jgi:molybdopterin synthase sulfur carrier subunit